MTTPTILFNDVPRIHFWGSTAPYEVRDPHSSSAPIEHHRIMTDHNQRGSGQEEDPGDDFENDSEDGYMETILADSSLDDFVMIPANIYGESQNSNSRPSHARMDASTERQSNGSSAGKEGQNESIFRTFLGRCRSSIQSEDSPRPRQDKKKPPILGSNRWAASRSSTIYSSYDWVSEVVVDEEGRRLILPGQVVVLGEERQRSEGFYDSRHPSSTSEHDSENPAAAIPRRADLSSLFESSTIMLSAYDLLATQNDKQDKLEFEQTPRGSARSSLTSPGYHTGTISTKIACGLRRCALQRLDRVHHHFARTTYHLKKGVSSQLQRVEMRFHILATISDIAIHSCDWLLPTPLRELEESTGAPTDPIGDTFVSIEMATLETDVIVSASGHQQDTF